MSVFEDTDVVRNIARLDRIKFNRVIRDGKVAFIGEMLGYDRHTFTKRVKRVRQTNINLAEAGLKHSQKTLSTLTGNHA